MGGAMKSDKQVREQILRKLDELGELERVRAKVEEILEREGWQGKVASLCDEFIDEKGVESITAKDVEAHVKPRAREVIPSVLKSELLEYLRDMFAKNAEHLSQFNEAR